MKRERRRNIRAREWKRRRVKIETGLKRDSAGTITIKEMGKIKVKILCMITG